MRVVHEQSIDSTKVVVDNTDYLVTTEIVSDYKSASKHLLETKFDYNCADEDFDIVDCKADEVGIVSLKESDQSAKSKVHELNNEFDSDNPKNIIRCEKFYFSCPWNMVSSNPESVRNHILEIFVERKITCLLKFESKRVNKSSYVEYACCKYTEQHKRHFKFVIKESLMKMYSNCGDIIHEGPQMF